MILLIFKNNFYKILTLIFISNFFASFNLVLANDESKPLKIHTFDTAKPQVFKESGSLVESYFENDKLVNPIMLEARIDIPVELSLEKVLQIALRNNLDYLYAKEEQEKKKWVWKENLAMWLPDYSTGFDFRRFDGNFFVGGVFPVSTLTSNVNAFMRLDYKFFDGGKKIFNTLASRNFYKSSIESLSASLKDTLFLVSVAYNKLLSEQSHLEVYAKSVEEAQAVLKLNQDLEESGAGTKFNVLQAEADLAENQQSFIQQQAKFREASINLAKLLNLDQDVHIKPDFNDLEPRRLIDTDKPIQDFLNIAFKNRSEIKKAELEYYAQKNLIALSASDYFPNANVFAQYGGTGSVIFNRTKLKTVIPDAIQVDQNGNPVQGRSGFSDVINDAGKPFRVAVNDSLMSNKSIGVEVDWAFGKGLGLPTLAKIKQARNEKEQYKIKLDKVKNQIEQEVRTAYLNTQTSERMLEVSEKRVNASKEALRLAKLRLENGVGINTELLDSQKNFKNALASKVISITDYNNSQAELLHSLGLISVESLTVRNN